MTTEAMTIGEVARLSGVSVRTLHHYDRIGLLSPAQASSAGYRLYVRPELERLQQILFYREIGLPLARIKRLMQSGGFDRVQALREHRSALERRRRRLDALLATIDATLSDAQGDNNMSTKELFSGFDVDAVLRRQEEYRTELDADPRYDPALVAESRRRVAGYVKADMGRVLAEQQTIAQAFADGLRSGRNPADPVVQNLVERHRQFINERFYPCSPEIHAGLGRMYQDDQRFADWWDAFAPGLAVFVTEAFAVRYGRPV